MDVGVPMSKDKDIVIIGCGASGGTAAQFARKTDRKASITVIEQGKYPQYSKCGLPYAIAGVIPHFTDLIEFSEEWFAREHINLLLQTTVEDIDHQNHCVIARRGTTTIKQSYDVLILATGAKPWIPPIEQLRDHNQKLLQGVFVVRTLDDAKQISSFAKKGKKATIVGAGLIGLEMADCLYKKGMMVTVVEALPTILANTLDADLTEPVLKKIKEHVSVLTNHLVIRAESKNGSITGVVAKEKETTNETRIDTDVLIISTGCKPEILLAKKLGCLIGEKGGILVNNRTETSIPDVYAVGDCTQYVDFVTNQPILVGLGSIGVRQGITAGINAAGGDYQLPKGLLQTCTSEFFGVEIAAVGPPSNKITDISMISGKFTGSSLPSYFPGGEPITIKVISQAETGRILAAQAVGSNAAQRINTFACAILNEMTVENLRKLETAYAPPIAPTLDAVTLACDVVALKMNRRQRSP